MEQYKGVIIPNCTKHQKVEYSYCHAADTFTECNTIFCHECLFNYRNIEYFLEWSIINRREEKLERILNGRL